MRVAVFGAFGQTGRAVCAEALDRGHAVTAHVPPGTELPIDEEELTIVRGDVYEGDGVTTAVTDVDAVVNVLGQRRDAPTDFLTVAGDHVLAAMHEASVDRYVALLGAGVRADGEIGSLSERVMRGLLKLLAQDVLADSTAHARRVEAADLDWTIIRVPRVTDEEPTGRYRIGDVQSGVVGIDRADVAVCLIDRVEADDYLEEMPKVAHG